MLMYTQDKNKVYRKIFDGENFVTQVRIFDTEDEATKFVNSGKYESNTMIVSSATFVG